MEIKDYKINWTCRFHPTDSFHEIGCPHRIWTKEDLQSALETAKRNLEYHFDILKEHPEFLTP